MVYDGQAVIDHFKRVDDRTLMGIMNGKSSLVRDHHFISTSSATDGRPITEESRDGTGPVERRPDQKAIIDFVEGPPRPWHRRSGSPPSTTTARCGARSRR